MKTFVDTNVTLITDDGEGSYIIVKDEISGIVQQLAITDEEIPRIKEVIEQWQEKK